MAYPNDQHGHQRQNHQMIVVNVDMVMMVIIVVMVQLQHGVFYQKKDVMIYGQIGEVIGMLLVKFV